MRLILPFLAVVLLSGCNIEDFGPSDRYEADFHYTLKPAGRLSVDNFNGEVEIAGWDQPSVEITGVKYASTRDVLDAIKIDVHESPAITEIRTIHPAAWHGNSGARYHIRLPRDTVVDRIVSSNGAVRVHDIATAARVHTSNGVIRVESTSGEVDAETSNGAILLDSVTGKLNLKTSNGRIVAEDVAGQCDAETSNGPVTLRFANAPDGPTRINTSNGSVHVTMPKPPKNGIRAETSNGSITLDLPGNTAARVDAQASRLSVSSDFDLTDSSGSDKRRHLEGNIGASGPLIELSTRNGSIRLRKTAASAN
jgi:hypothetical protein